MRHRHLSPEYAYAAGCLVLREHYAGKLYFHYPLSLTGDEEEEFAAIREIQDACRNEDVRLHFTNVPKSRLGRLVAEAGQEVLVTDIRRWRDYLYRAEDFKTYAGGKYSGQRNHVNKFKKSYPDWAFHVYAPQDESAIKAFLKEYEGVQRKKHDYLADEEMNEVYELLPKIGEFGLCCGYLTAGGKIIACSVGERCGDMLVVHVEKALRDYEGAYPFMAQQFALAFCGEEIGFLNRMDDAADRGLRKSKLQYLPCELVDKYNVVPKRAIDGVSRLPVIKTERLTLAPVKDKDGEEYRRLACDTDRNRYWGYDWREDSESGEVPDADWFLALARGDFKAKREMPLGIYADAKLVGEVVLHRFGYRSEAEIGVRLLPEAEGNCYAAEAVRAYAEYAFLRLGLELVEAKRHRENERSGRTLARAGMRPCGEDETYFYYRLTAAM
ncbi:MAG: GNAT family N-acetyltransferase [Clostridia bacterium]|nr:GNAT family N-acetyltransferase [Clostridia bacterium]